MFLQYFTILQSQIIFSNRLFIMNNCRKYTNLLSFKGKQYIYNNLFQESIQDHEAYYEGGTIKFDKCVIATGSLYNFPIKSLTPKVGGRFIEIKRIHE